MNSEQSNFDIVIIGGGISGLGVALAATSSGYKTILLEKGSCAEATSANSLRIMHGGFRYLQSLHLPRILESCRDQQFWLREVPDLIRPLPCLIPLSARGLRSSFPVGAAAFVFGKILRWLSPDGLPNGFEGPRILSANEAAKRVPLWGDMLKQGALLWYDATLRDPNRFANLLIERISTAGGAIHQGANVTEVQLGAKGAGIEYVYQGISRCASAQVVINATGPWLFEIPITPHHSRRSASLNWCKAFNLLIDRKFDELHGLGFYEASGRVYFIVPREDTNCSALGTWYVPFTDDPNSLTVSSKEVEEFLAAVNQAVPLAQLSASEVVAVEVGLLPMKYSGTKGPQLFGASQLLRSGRLIEVLSTKYTTFKSQGEKVLRLAKPLLES